MELLTQLQIPEVLATQFSVLNECDRRLPMGRKVRNVWVVTTLVAVAINTMLVIAGAERGMVVPIIFMFIIGIPFFAMIVTDAILRIPGDFLWVGNTRVKDILADDRIEFLRLFQADILQHNDRVRYANRLLSAQAEDLQTLTEYQQDYIEELRKQTERLTKILSFATHMAQEGELGKVTQISEMVKEEILPNQPVQTAQVALSRQMKEDAERLRVAYELARLSSTTMPR